MLELLDCGHSESEHESFTSGFGVTKAGKRLCYACCEALDRQELLDRADFWAYMSRDEKHITGWPGWVLMDVTDLWTKRVGFGGVDRYYIRAIDVHGQKWHGTGAGPGCYVRMKKNKLR